MTAREPISERTIVDIDDYFDRIPDRLRAEDLDDPNEVYLFYAPLASRMSRVAVRAYASINVHNREDNGIRATGALSIRDTDLSLLGSDTVFPGLLHAGFFVPDKPNPIIVKRRVVKRPITMGVLVRGDETFADELAEVKARLDLERESELVTS